jgi:hypothetical protein
MENEPVLATPLEYVYTNVEVVGVPWYNITAIRLVVGNDDYHKMVTVVPFVRVVVVEG